MENKGSIIDDKDQALTDFFKTLTIAAHFVGFIIAVPMRVRFTNPSVIYSPAYPSLQAKTIEL